MTPLFALAPQHLKQQIPWQVILQMLRSSAFKTSGVAVLTCSKGAQIKLAFRELMKEITSTAHKENQAQHQAVSQNPKAASAALRQHQLCLGLQLDVDPFFMFASGSLNVPCPPSEIQAWQPPAVLPCRGRAPEGRLSLGRTRAALQLKLSWV